MAGILDEETPAQAFESLPERHMLSSRRAVCCMCKCSRTTLSTHVPYFLMSSPPTSSSATPPSLNGGASPETSSFPFTTASQQDAVKQLSGVLSHHLGTLTSTISGYADLLMDARDEQEQREIAMNVLEASTRIDDLLADLRHYSRSLEPAFRTVSVPEVAKSTTHLLTDSERERVCQKVEPPAGRKIEADPRLLRQALLNLLHNALEASAPSEDVLLRVTADDSETADPVVAFEVWNDGEIPVDDPRELFQPFYSTRPQHLGLGLPFANYIAAQHGGAMHLTANSATEGGTCFTLTI